MAKSKKVTMDQVMNDPAYRGYHVIVVAGKVFKARTGERASEILDEIEKKYPHQIPTITYIPDADSLHFLKHNEIPPLMGRYLFLETFKTVFSPDHTVTFSQ